MKPLLLAMLICGHLHFSALKCWARKWSDTSGKFSVEAELVEVQADKVVLRKAGGERVTVPLARLSESDRRHLTSLDKSVALHKGPVADPKINALLQPVQQQFDVPALAAAIVTSDGLEAFGVAGIRKRGTKSRATPNDLWHLGSNTKAMTATLVARLVDQGQLSWETTICEVFPDGDFTIHPDFRDVTILQLLSHRAGLPANLNLVDFWGADAVGERHRAVELELAKPPQTTPGSKYEYSNLGYIIVGAMVEKETGKSWEENMAEHVFRPLEMTGVGFGGTGTPGKLDQPWSHTADGKPVSQNGPEIDNPPVMGPAGRVHCSIQDWSKYVADVLRGMAGKKALLPNAAYKKMATPPFGGDYALGWIVAERDWAGGTVLQHSGSNTMNFATMWIAPKRDFAILACTNQGGDAAASACDAAVVALLEYRGALNMDRPARRSDPEPPAESDSDADELAIDEDFRRRLEGRYQLAPNFIFTVRDRDGHLMVSITDQPTQEVFPDSPTRWSYRGVDATLEFKLPKTGRARSLVLHQNGMEQTARRIK